MTLHRDTVCSCCGKAISLAPLLTVYGPVDLAEGLCRDCLALADVGRRRLLQQVRLELRIDATRFTLFLQSWRAVKLQAIERLAGRRLRLSRFTYHVRRNILGLVA